VTKEVALDGFDGEIGWRVPVFDAAGPMQLRLYGGGYSFSADNVQSVEGPRARLDLTLDEVPGLWAGSRLTLGAEVQHDGPRGTQYFVMAQLRIPLNFFGAREAPARLTPQERRMTDRVVRDVDIVSQVHTVATPAVVETATETSGGAPLTVIDSASTSGAALPGAVAAAASNSTVVLSGTFNTTATTALQSGQSLVGGDITVRSASGRTATLHTSATISSSNLTRMIEAPGNNTISGLTIVATHSTSGGTAINLNSTGGNYTVTNNTITVTQTGAVAGTGIATDRNFNVVISGNEFTSTGGTTATAVGLAGLGTTGVTVTGNTFNVSGATNNVAVSVTNATINTGSTGNVLTAGTCSGTSTSGFIGFTNGTTCP
jgi:hypothetical protein